MTKKYSLYDQTTNNDFVKRHIGPRPHQQIEMLKAIGFNSFEEMTKNNCAERYSRKSCNGFKTCYE